LISKYEQYYSNEKDNVLNKMSFKEIYASQTESVWSDKRPSKKKKSTRTFFKSSKNLFRLNKEEEKLIGEMKNNIFEEAFNTNTTHVEDETSNDEDTYSEKNISRRSSLQENTSSKEQNEEEIYFLKLINKAGVNCFANCIVQAILSLGPIIYESVLVFFFIIISFKIKIYLY
jgi:hypothetical protein